MRVVQFNTHHGGKRTDGVLDTPGLGRAIKRLNPDVVCLNEVEQFHGYGNQDCAALLAAALGPEWRPYFVNEAGVVGGHGAGNAILARLADVGSPALPKRLHDNRVALALKVRNVTIIAVHLDNDKAANRVIETVQLFQWDALRDASPVVVAGDLNGQPSSVEIQPFRVLLKDAWQVALDAGHATSFNKTGYTKSTRIDYVCYRGLTLESCDVPDTRNDPAGAFPSDHHPVVATFK